MGGIGETQFTGIGDDAGQLGTTAKMGKQQQQQRYNRYGTSLKVFALYLSSFCTYDDTGNSAQFEASDPDD